jgi:hypothetical protein
VIDPHPELDQNADAKLLGHKIAGEATGILDQDDADAVTLNPFEQCGEAAPAFDRVCAAHGWVVEPIGNLIGGRLGEPLDHPALRRLAVLVGADICGRRVVAERGKACQREHLGQCGVATLSSGECFPLTKMQHYRRYAQACLEIADTIVDEATRATFIQMAQVWFRLAEEKALQPQSSKEDTD